MANKTAYASGNSVSLKSFQSYAVNAGLLAKVVEAVKAGEKDSRTSGIVKSLEIFYSGFRQNISIGRIFIVPAKVCDTPQSFPVALLYGTVVRELNLGEETSDLIAKKMGDSEFDEFSQISFSGIKDKLFMGEDGTPTSLVLFAPNWSNIREYVGFKFTDDDEKLSNLLRHLVFASYFNPAVSSAFDALMTTVDTHKLDITDITPKLTYPFLSENPLRQYPDLSKQGGWAKKKIFLTVKTADAITQETLDPAELNVFEALDSALAEATMPATEPMEDVAEFNPNGTNSGNAEIPEIADIKRSIENTKESSVDDSGATTGLRNRPDYGEADSYTAEANDANAKAARLGRCPDCNSRLDGFSMCPNTDPKDAAKGTKYCGKGWTGEASKDTQREQAADPTRVASAKKAEAPFEVPFTNVGPGAAAHDHADTSIAVKVDTISQKGEAPIGIELDDTGLPVREDKSAAHIARAIAKDFTEAYDASSTKTKAARAKREAELNKYATRRKMANVPLTEESIWDDITEDFGEAPQVELPSDSGKSDGSAPEETKTPETKEAPAAEESKKTEYKSNLFKGKGEKEEPEEPKAEEKKEASKKKADGVEGDVSEAKSLVESTSVVDADIKQPVKSVPEAAKVSAIGPTGENGKPGFVSGEDNTQDYLSDETVKSMNENMGRMRDKVDQIDPDLRPWTRRAADISGDVAEAKTELDAGAKKELADSPEATQTVNPEHFAAEWSPVTKETLQLAKELIDTENEIALDVAAEQGQMFENVKDMSWFVKTVAEEIAGSEDIVRQHLEQSAHSMGTPAGYQPVVNRVVRDLEENPKQAAAGDEHDEAVEMTLGMGDLADLAANLPHQDTHTAAKKKAEWKDWTPEMPVQVVGVDNGQITPKGHGVQTFPNLAAAQVVFPDLNPSINGKRFTWAMYGKHNGQPAIRFETWEADNMYSA